jgi:RNA polymerase sigma-70 factor, ECF subfamily
MIHIDKTYFEKVFHEFYSSLCRYSIQFVRRPEIAEEIVQELFIYLWDNKNELQIHTSIKSYLYVAVKNRSISYLQSKYTNIQFLSEEASYQLIENTDPHSRLENEELSEIFTKAINSLPEKCYIIFSMRRHGEYTNKEIAHILNISEKTVENQISIAFKKLRSILSKGLLILFLILFF